MTQTASPTLIREIAQFLQQHLPFNQIGQQDLEMLAAEVKLQYFEAGEYIFRQDDPPYPYFFIVKRGSIHVIQDLGDEATELIDTCAEGDVFGVRALLAGDNYIASALAKEEALLYEIPIARFQPILEQYPKVMMYFVAGFASGITVLKPENLQNTRAANAALGSPTGWTNLAIDALQIPLRKKIIACTPETSIQAAARLMNTHNIGSMLITNEMGLPIGIMTDADFRKKLLSQDHITLHSPVSTLMSAPVKTIHPTASVAEITLTMARHKITHLCITEDGTDSTPAVGMVSQRDVLVAQGNNPAVLIKQMMAAEDADALARLRHQADELVKMYLGQGVGIGFISYIITQINDVMIAQALRLAEVQVRSEGVIAPPHMAYCWLSLGSEGRKEQLRRTDQDNALVYANPVDNRMAMIAKTYFQLLSQATCDILVQCGFEECPAQMMASNPRWCLSLEEWQEQFGKWIDEPEPAALLYANIFFDFRPVAGDAALAQSLKQFIFQRIDKSDLFLPFLAKNALQNPPPLSFFRQFMVEKSGEHKHEFDLKARAMMPLSDAARVLAYQFRLDSYGSTIERLEAVAACDENIHDLCKAAAMAYEILLRLRADFGFRKQNSGRFIHPDELNKLERQTVRNIFKTIEKMQQMLSTRFQLSNFR